MMKMDASNNIFDKKKDEWQTKINQSERALEKKKASLHEEKARHRHQLTEEESRHRKLEEEIHELNKWIFKLVNKRKAAEAATKIATTKFYRAKEESYGRLQKLRKETQSRRAKEDELTSTSKALCRSEKELEITKSLLETPQDTKRRMKKVWDDIDADRHLGWQCRQMCLPATPLKRQTFLPVADMSEMSSRHVGDILLCRPFFWLSASCLVLSFPTHFTTCT
jgi:hypothetical protein